MAYLALFVALGGSSYAALSVTGRNVKDGSLTGKDVRNSSLTGRDVKNSSLTGRDVKNGRLTGSDILESSLGKVPRASQADGAASAGNADKLDGSDSSAFVRGDDKGLALAGAAVVYTGEVASWFNRFGGAPTVSHATQGQYELTFPGLEGRLNIRNVVQQVTLSGGGPGDGYAGFSGDNIQITTRDETGAVADRGFYYMVHGTNLGP